MKQLVVILLFVLGLPVCAGAQSFLGNLKKKTPGGGVVTVSEGADIDELVDNARLDGGAAAAQGTAAGAAKGPAVAAARPSGQSEGVARPADTRQGQAATQQGAQRDDGEQAADSSKKVMAGAGKVVGYRIQVFAGGNSREDRQRAERISGAIKRRFPDLPVYVHFYSPRWICRAGNFRAYEDAARVLRDIKGMGYSQACIVKGKINVRR